VLGNILDTNKIENKKLELCLTTCNLKESLIHIIKMNEKRAYDKNINIRLKLGRNVPEFVSLDQGRLTQILLNLVGNSVKFTAKGSVLLKADWAEMENPDRVAIKSSAELNDRHQVLETVSGNWRNSV
jgi:signal transduction histidine kinase